MNFNLIHKLTNEQESLEERIDSWYLEFVQPRINCCSSFSELNGIWQEVSMACAEKDGMCRDLPGLLNVKRAFSYDSVRQKLEKAFAKAQD